MTVRAIAQPMMSQAGLPGAPGEGVPAGGLAGAVPYKASGDDYHTAWSEYFNIYESTPNMSVTLTHPTESRFDVVSNILTSKTARMIATNDYVTADIRYFDSSSEPYVDCNVTQYADKDFAGISSTSIGYKANLNAQGGSGFEYSELYVAATGDNDYINGVASLGNTTLNIVSTGTASLQLNNTDYRAVGSITETKTDDYTPVTADAGKLLLFDKSTAVDCTIDTALNLTAGQQIKFIQIGAGLLSFVADTGVTINTLYTLDSLGQYATQILTCVGTDSYVLSGELATP